MAAQSMVWSVLYFVGMLAVFVGERVIGAGTGRSMTVIGVLLILAATGLRLSRVKKATPEGKKIEMSILLLYAVGAVSLLLYFLQSDLASSVLGKPLEKDWPRLAVVLAALYPAGLTAALAPLLLVEMAYAAVARAPELEPLRIRDAMLSGLGLAGALVFAFTISYVASERDKKVDLSYFRTAKAGEASRKIAGTLDQPIQVSLFFPPANEVREEVEGYFKDLTAISKMIELHKYDYAVDPAKAKELGVSGNGIVVVSRAGRKELLSVGLELEAARSQLRNLDKEVQKRILQVARPQRTIYLTAGHGERGTMPLNDTDKRGTIRDLREVMQQQGYILKDLGAADGLAADVPNDAAIVMSIGPQKPYLPEEISALARYLDRGGRLLFCFDPEAGMDQAAVLQPLGLKLSTTILANDQIYARRSYQASDKMNIATGSYSSHPVATTLGRLGMRAPMVLLGAGSLEEIKDKAKELSIDFPVKAHPQTWNDANGNFAFDAPAEQRKGWNLAAAVTKKKPGVKTEAKDEGRILVLADSDAIIDGIIGNPGNAYFVLDGTKWLLGDEAITGEVSSEVDVPIAHTKKEDVAWFYMTIFLAPMLALGAGWLVMRKRKQRPAKEAK